jgi:predicted amidohydrolase YtcJ
MPSVIAWRWASLPFATQVLSPTPLPLLALYRNLNLYLEKGPYKDERLTVQSFKMYSDGALGSRGACLIQSYSDRPGHYGLLLSTPAYMDSVIKVLADSPFQLCTHAIGDSANRLVLGMYAAALGPNNDRRWRIEHAQVVHEDDFHFFREYKILPSVQPTHATSDMYWAEERLGPERIHEAYAYRTLYEQLGIIPLGTDFPIEGIDPLNTFYAAVVRKDAQGWPEGGFRPEEALDRKTALKGMTWDAAYAQFEEKEKGSLELGKLADFVIFDTDLLGCAEQDILKAKVLRTYINGECVYNRN